MAAKEVLFRSANLNEGISVTVSLPPGEMIGATANHPCYVKGTGFGMERDLKRMRMKDNIMNGWTDLEYKKILRATEENDLIVVSNLISKCGQFDHFNGASNFPSPLLLALDWRGQECVIPPENAALVQILIEAGAEINVRNTTSETPLIIAAWTGKYNTVSVLLGAKANVNDSTDYGYTSLIAAAQYGYNDIVTVLLSHGANVNMQTADGLTALMRAASGGYTKTVRILIAHGADVHSITKHGDTALTLAREARHYKLAHLILSLSS